MEPVKMEEGKDMGIESRLEEEEEEGGRLTSSRMGYVSATESSQMFMSLLTESSSTPYDSSMQVCERNFTPRQLRVTFVLHFIIFLTFMNDLI